jgi:hypothetical protein
VYAGASAVSCVVRMLRRVMTFDNLPLVRLLDNQYTRTAFYDVLKMTAWLCQNGHLVNCK